MQYFSFKVFENRLEFALSSRAVVGFVVVSWGFGLSEAKCEMLVGKNDGHTSSGFTVHFFSWNPCETGYIFRVAEWTSKSWVSNELKGISGKPRENRRYVQRRMQWQSVYARRISFIQKPIPPYPQSPLGRWCDDDDDKSPTKILKWKPNELLYDSMGRLPECWYTLNGKVLGSNAT